MPFHLSKQQIRWSVAAVIAAGTILRFDLFSAFQYDEIWSLTYYATQPVKTIFSELGTPNNHPLNSLLMKVVLGLGGESIFALRLPNFLAGIGAMFLMYPVAAGLLGSRTGGVLALCGLAFSPLAVIYSAQARGYETELFLLLLFYFSLLKGKQSKYRGICYLAAFLAGTGAMLTISAAVLFIVPATVFVWWKHRRDFRCWLFAGGLGGFILAWYLGNFEAFRAGQNFGTKLDSLAAIRGFLGELASTLFPGGIAVLALPALWGRKRRSRIARGIAGAVLFPLAAAFATRAGMARVYLPSVIGVSVLEAGGVMTLCRIAAARCKWKTAWIILLTGGCVIWHVAVFYSAYPQLRFPDWNEIYALHRRSPVKELIVYPANAAMAAGWNNPAVGEEMLQRLEAPESLLMLFAAHSLNGVDGAYGEKEIAFSGGETLNLGPCRALRCRLSELAAPPPSGSLVLAIAPEGAGPLARKGLRLNRLLPLPEGKKKLELVLFRYLDGALPEGLRCFVLK